MNSPYEDNTYECMKFETRFGIFIGIMAIIFIIATLPIFI